MRIKIRFLTVVMAALMLLAFAGCSNINNPDADDTEETESEQVETAEEAASATTARPSPPVETPRPDRTEKPQTSSATGEAGFEVGDVLPDFSVPLVGGGTFTLAENLGKPVFINIFATWCPPCVGEMPEINQLYTELGDQVTFIVIDLGEDEATAQNFADGNGYSVPFAYSLDGVPFADYYVEFIPQTFVLSADGTIVQYFGGSSDYEGFKAAIEAAMAQ